jgi:beta-galactosidase
MNHIIKNSLIISIFSLMVAGCVQPQGQRNHIILNGEWEIAKTASFDETPSTFGSKVPVPGLVDLAIPVIDNDKKYDTGTYWYKTSFSIYDEYPELVKLYIGKAKYYARIYLNQKLVGDHVYCFTSATFDIRPLLNPPGQSNELMIGLGTYNKMPDTVIWGHDFEKLTYIPGIYDDVKIILTGGPYIKNVQTVPMIDEEKVRVVADIDGGDGTQLTYLVREVGSGRIVANGQSSQPDFTVSIPDCKLWSPESPFLYSLQLSTDGDELTTRFGMRSFSFDTVTNMAMLNGRPYFMRGTNVCIFRFFEDPDRGLLPWDSEWVTNLHQKFKYMHWNSIRYCIGLPPARWYEIADSLGFLIQNEYPVWTGNRFSEIYPGVASAHLANEYRAWLPEHWNHPSVVIWDAQNESITDITGEAINMVRDMDLSNRPWENGWSPPQAATDPIESHPYLFGGYRRAGAKPPAKGPLSKLNTVHIPDNDANDRYRPREEKRYSNPIIINEYAWLWLNRDGTTTTLTDRVYDVLFGENLTSGQRLDIYGRHLGIKTEYWRAHRLCAGVLHFCGLAYSRSEEPRGQTSDHFIDINILEYEPLFVKYVRPSFSPVGLMVNFWEQAVEPNQKFGIEVYVINDLDERWSGYLSLTLFRDGKEVSRTTRQVSIPNLERLITTFPIEMPFQHGEYQLEAEINYQGEAVKSIREFKVGEAPGA